MSNDLPRNSIDPYLDGSLSAEERTVFEHELAADARLRAEVDYQEEIDASLRRLFRNTGSPPGLGIAPEHAQLSVGKSDSIGAIRRLRPYLLAASLLLVAGGAWIGWTFWQASRFQAPTPVQPTSLDSLYRQQVERGFRPDWKCGTDQEFADTVRDRFGVPLVIAPAPDVAVLGWGRAGAVMKGKTAMLLIRAHEAPSIVLMGELKNDPKLSLDPSSPLRLHRREIGDIVLYEVTPGQHNSDLGLFHEPIPTVPTDAHPDHA